MAWEQLDIDKPHLAYIIIGGFTSLFMLCSLFVKEKLYIGEATVATICGIIFGPHAANLFNPADWGNTDKITLECSRIVLVVQCFAVGVELPKSYMERHWRSVTFLLVPVMTFGWLITSLFIWWMIVPLSWLQSLAVAACVTATDPVLASSVVGKGKFAKRVPKHLRDVLSAESGCNDGMAFPFIYLALYLIRFGDNASDVVFHWTCFTILYECIFGAFYGFMIGYIGRHAIKGADKYGLIDRESFLVFYFVLALFCAGSGSLLGMDDLLIGFSAGVGFSNDGWFTTKTEEAHVSNVIDLLLNLSYFVYFGSIVPWEQFNNVSIGLEPWRLVVIAIMVIFFRRIPAMMAFKPFIPDIKNWREALFAGHFGPIGVGAVFAAMLAKAELENDLNSTEPLAILPGPESKNYLVIQLIWPVVSFLVVTSIIVHGSSIAVFTLGKRINTLTLTMSYTQANESNWLNRLPRIASTSRSMSKGRFDSTEDLDEKLHFPPGTLPPVGLPGGFLRRQREEDNPSRANSRASSLRPPVRRKKRSSGMGAGGPISQSAIMPQRHIESPNSPTSPMSTSSPTVPGSPDATRYSEAEGAEGEPPDQLEMQERADEETADSPDNGDSSPEIEAYEEGDHMIVEDEEGNVLSDENIRGETDEEIKGHIDADREALRKETSGEHAKTKTHPHERNEGEELERIVSETLEHPSKTVRALRKRLGEWNSRRRKEAQPKSIEERLRGPAHAYQYGNTIIVEDEDGEVVRKYDIPAGEKRKGNAEATEATGVRYGLRRVGTWAGIGGAGPPTSQAEPEGGDQEGQNKNKAASNSEDDDARLRFTIGSGGRRMSKQDFIKQIQSLDPKARVKAIKEANAPEPVKKEVGKHTDTPPTDQQLPSHSSSRSSSEVSPHRLPELQRPDRDAEDRAIGDTGLTLVDSNGTDIPVHSVSESIARVSMGHPETAAQRRRRLASTNSKTLSDPDNDNFANSGSLPPGHKDDNGTGPSSSSHSSTSPKSKSPNPPRPAQLHHHQPSYDGETAAEKRRRLAALGQGGADDDESDSDDEDGGERLPRKGRAPVAEPSSSQDVTAAASTARGVGGVGIRFADSPAPSQARSVQWGVESGSASNNKHGRGRRGFGGGKRKD